MVQSVSPWALIGRMFQNRPASGSRPNSFDVHRGRGCDGTDLEVRDEDHQLQVSGPILLI